VTPGHKQLDTSLGTAVEGRQGDLHNPL
jgi:hypothetical protein